MKDDTTFWPFTLTSSSPELIPYPQQSWVYSINVNTNLNLGNKWSFQGNVNYLSKRPTTQGED
ncbi:hypothetical protein [Hanamia caeni]|uniref:hypothetical protein n=1 Tax=Hanamia caeni TaxID=2294116 RepID=UPI0018F72583|nr:hypothetical protein [Hanamia caeni]